MDFVFLDGGRSKAETEGDVAYIQFLCPCGRLETNGVLPYSVHGVHRVWNMCMSCPSIRGSFLCPDGCHYFITRGGYSASQDECFSGVSVV